MEIIICRDRFINRSDRVLANTMQERNRWYKELREEEMRGKVSEFK
jgi:hypothetical protein